MGVVWVLTWGCGLIGLRVMGQRGRVHRLGGCVSRSLILHILLTAAVLFIETFFISFVFVRHCSSPAVRDDGLSH